MLKCVLLDTNNYSLMGELKKFRGGIEAQRAVRYGTQSLFDLVNHPRFTKQYIDNVKFPGLKKKLLIGAGVLVASACLSLVAKALLSGAGSLSAIGGLLGDVLGSAILAGQGSISVIAESWHILTSQEYQDLLEGQIEFQEI